MEAAPRALYALQTTLHATYPPRVPTPSTTPPAAYVPRGPTPTTYLPHDLVVLLHPPTVPRHQVLAPSAQRVTIPQDPELLHALHVVQEACTTAPTTSVFHVPPAKGDTPHGCIDLR